MRYIVVFLFLSCTTLFSCDKGSQQAPKVSDDNSTNQNGDGTTASGSNTTAPNTSATGTTTTATNDSSTTSNASSTTQGNNDGNSSATSTSYISGGKAVIPFKAGRFAVSHDGNQHDTDDYGASAAILQMTKAGGRTSNLVHFEINNHLGDSNSVMAAQMRASVKAAGFDTSPVYFDIDGGPGAAAAQKHLTAEIEKSTPSDPLYIIAAGPMSTVASALLAATKGTENTLVISHSGWNNSHKDTPQLLYTWTDIKSPKVQISDQNVGLGPGKTSTITDAVIKARDIKGDISDAGMYLYLMTGHQDTSAQMLNDYINKKGAI